MALDLTLRVFRSPTKDNISKAFIGIPDEIKLNENITTIELQQVEILSPPETIWDLRRVRETIENVPVNGSKNVVETELTAGFSLVPSVIGLPWFFVPSLEVQEVILPDGFIHLDDISDWDVFNYNSSWQLADTNFKLLPGEERVPREASYELVYKNNEFFAEWQSPITAVHVYYQRVSELVNDWEWTKWKTFTKDDKKPAEFQWTGEYKLRAIPYYGSYPLAGWKEYEINFPENEELSWTYLQLAPNKYQIKLSGIVGTEVNMVKFFEDGELLSSRNLIPDNMGRIDTTIFLNNVSRQEFPRILLKFYRKFKSYVAYIFSEELMLEKNYAYESVELTVKRLSNGKYQCTIFDPKELLYSPISPLGPFSGADWISAIQSKKLIAKLEITRHQSGVKTSYGMHYINITSEINSNFLNSPPFETGIEKIAGGFKFIFEDTIEFRDLANLDTPDLDKELSYEFRLIFWSAGIEDSLRKQEEFIYIKEVPIIINNRRGSHKYAYNVWKMEHPMSKYRNIVPLDIANSKYENHIRYGRSQQGIILQDEPIAVQKTYDVSISHIGWSVMYYYSAEDDELQEFPYYKFDINIPPTSQLSIDSIQISVENGGIDLNLGTYHPSDTINIVDFLGYYLARKIFTKLIDFRAPIDAFEKTMGLSPTSPMVGANPPLGQIGAGTSRGIFGDFSSKAGVKINPSAQASKTPKTQNLPAPIPNYPIVTKAAINDQTKMIRNLNKKVSDKITEKEVVYNITINYEGRSPHVITVRAKISQVPTISQEPEENQSLAIGNKTVLPDALLVPATLAIPLLETIEETSAEETTKSTYQSRKAEREARKAERKAERETKKAARRANRK